jgi:hypothetical protein
MESHLSGRQGGEANRCLPPSLGCRINLAASGKRRFAPDQSGNAMAHSLSDYLVGRAGLDQEEYERWLADLETCDQEGSYSYSRTHYSYFAVSSVARPSVGEREAP